MQIIVGKFYRVADVTTSKDMGFMEQLTETVIAVMN